MQPDFQKFIQRGLGLVLCFVLLCGLTSNAYSQESGDATPRDKLADILNNSDQQVDPVRPLPLPGESTDPRTSELYEKALQDYYSYRSTGMQHRQAVFKWQLFSAKLIFAIALVLVASGVIFAAIQFRIGIQEQKNVAGGADRLSTEMELSTSGIKINSPVLGVIILTISLAFFYLYLVYVYPIENIF